MIAQIVQYSIERSLAPMRRKVILYRVAGMYLIMSTSTMKMPFTNFNLAWGFDIGAASQMLANKRCHIRA